MRTNLQFLRIVLWFGCLPAMGEQKRVLPVTVVDVHVTPVQPVKHVRLQLSTISGVGVISQSVSMTNDKGMVSVEVDTASAAGTKLLISLFPGDAPGLVVYEPSGGIIEALPTQLTLKLLPKGSPALLGPAEIEALLFKYSQTNQSLRTQTMILQGELASANRATKGLEAVEVGWAEQYGFSPQEVKEKVSAWADQVRAQHERKTLQQR